MTRLAKGAFRPPSSPFPSEEPGFIRHDFSAFHASSYFTIPPPPAAPRGGFITLSFTEWEARLGVVQSPQPGEGRTHIHSGTEPPAGILGLGQAIPAITQVPEMPVWLPGKHRAQAPWTPSGSSDLMVTHKSSSSGWKAATPSSYTQHHKHVA